MPSEEKKRRPWLGAVPLAVVILAAVLIAIIREHFGI